MRRRGFTLIEIICAMFILSSVFLIGGRMIKVPDLKNEYESRLFFSKVRAVFLKSRLSASVYDRRYTTIYLDSKGKLHYKNGIYLNTITDDDRFSVFVDGREGVASTINCSPNFKVTEFVTGYPAFTVLVKRGDRLIGKFIIQVGTAAVREEYYGN